MVIDQALIIKNKIKRVFIIGDGPFLDNFKLTAQNFLKKVYLLRPNKYINELKFKSDDLIFSINNKFIFKKKILKSGIFLNYHDSYLPYFRGTNSSTWAIIKKKKFHGCTFHFIKEGIDTGEIVYRKKFYIKRDYTSYDIDKISLFFGYKLFEKILIDVFLKKKIRFLKKMRKYTYYSSSKIMLIPLSGFIDLKWKIDQILRQYKALKVSKYKKNFILKPKLLTEKKKIIEIDTIKILGTKNFTVNHPENLNFIKFKNKFLIKKGNFLLEIKVKNKLKNLKFLSSKEIKNFLKNSKNIFKLN